MNTILPNSKLKQLKNMGFVFLLLIATSANSPSNKDKNSLSIFAHGICDAVSSNWINKAAILSSSKENYIIVRDDRTTNTELLTSSEDKYNVINRYPTPQNISPYISLVPVDHIIHFNPDDPNSVAALKKIGEKSNVNVFMDMNLGLNDFSFDSAKSKWDEQTEWAAEAAVAMAESHKKTFKNSSDITMYGHSAGTEVVGKAQQLTYNTKHHKNEQPLFRSIVASPRSLDKNMFPNAINTTIILADGDYYYSPGGIITIDDLTKTIGEIDAINFSKAGYKVVRIVGGVNWELNISEISIPKIAYALSSLTIPAMFEHSATNDLANQKYRLVAYLPGTADAFPVTNIQLGNFVNRFSNFDLKSTSDFNNTIQTIQKDEPTPNLGGISLNAIAEVPVNPTEVNEAGYNSSTESLYLLMNDGNVIRFPYIDPEAIRLAYECGYKKDEKPELSIGASPVRNDTVEVKQLNPPGMESVYYLGGAANTYLGLAMFLADKALSNLAFGSSSDIYEVSKAVSGFHSMPELFTAKYTYNPAQQRYLGSQNVFLNVGTVELILNEEDNAFRFGYTGLEVHFPNGGPAENYFASFFVSHFNEITETKQGEAFKLLIPYARATAVFRWLKSNSIYFNSEGILNIPITKVYTPSYTSPPKQISINEISPIYPAIIFGANGPLKIFYSADEQTIIAYKKGRPVKVVCPNGSSLDIYRDDMGIPIAYNTNDNYSGGFYIDPNLGALFIKNIVIQDFDQNMRFKLTNRSIVYPENQPEITFKKIISSFITSNRPK